MFRKDLANSLLMAAGKRNREVLTYKER